MFTWFPLKISSFLANQIVHHTWDDCHPEELIVDLILEGSKVFKSPTVKGDFFIIFNTFKKLFLILAPKVFYI
jgi:hypothetical protein